MAKTATVHAQQMWEYLSITRKTDEYLVAELNELGKLGWELVSATYKKDLRGGVGAPFSWTAILKRPLVTHGAPTPVSAAQASPTEPEAPRVFDTEPETFDVRS